MYTMASVPQRWCFGVGVVLLVLATCVLECSAQAQPTISGNGLFIVGQTKTMACYISTTEATSNFPLTWSRGGSTLTASDEQTLTVAGNVNYNTFYKLTVAASDNLAVFTCTSTLPSGTTSATWTVYVYKGPDTPIISGPSAVVSGVSNKWTCIVDGASGTSPSVYWQFGNGTRLPQSTFTNVAQVYTDSNQLEIHKETSTLTMTASTSAPSFTLVCKGYHYDTNSEVASELPVTVTYPPEVTGGNVNYTVTAGTTATLVCDVRASPSATAVFWNKDGALIDRTSGRYSGGTVASPSLVISAVVKGDTGYYTCGGTNGIGSTTGDRIYLLVRYAPIITYSQNPVGGVLGSDVTLSCNIDAVPAYTTVLWYRVDSVTGALTSISSTSNPSKYSGGTASTSPALTIKSLAADDAGLYRCKADNDVSRGEGANLQVQVNYKPKITVQSPVDATEPQSTTLNCIVDALPALTSLTWYKGGQLLDTSSTARYSGGTVSAPSLIIVKVGPADAGSYYCVASNSLGTTTSATITLTVQYFPVFTISETQVGGTVGGTVTLTVSLAANPAVTSLQWRKHVSSNVYTDLDVTTSKYSGGTVSSPDLQINSLSSSDIGNYVVVATNSLGSGQSVDITVDVSYVPTQPSIAGLQSSYKETELISLTCSASGFPAPAYRWYRGSSLVASTATLSIASATPSDNSQFTCEAYNTLGNAQATVSVNVQYKPRAGSGLSNVTASIGQDVTLTCTTDANPTPTSYVWYHGGRVVSPASSSSQWTVSVSNSSMLGSYSCIATNSEGASDSITVYVIQQTSGGGDTGGGSVGASTEDTSLSTATLALIIIICLIILIVLILVIVYCCAVKKCFKKDNDVGPTQTTQPPAAIPAQRAAKDSEPKLNGYYSMHVPQPVYTTSNGRISMDEDKTVVPAPAPAPAPAHTSLPYRGSGVSISVPGGGTPRPHHLPPLGQDGVPEEIEPAREEKTKEKKKKRRRRRHDGEDGSPRRNTPRHDPGV